MLQEYNLVFLLPSQNSGGGGGRNVGLGLQVALSVAAACPNSSLSAVRFCSVLLTDSISSDSWLNLKRGTAMAAAVPAPLLGLLLPPLLLLLLQSLSLLTPLSDGEAEDALKERGDGFELLRLQL